MAALSGYQGKYAWKMRGLILLPRGCVVVDKGPDFCPL